MRARAFAAGCGSDCPCRRARFFGENYVVFSTGRLDQLEEIVPGTRYYRRAHRPRARLRVFVRPDYLDAGGAR